MPIESYQSVIVILSLALGYACLKWFLISRENLGLQRKYKLLLDQHYYLANKFGMNGKYHWFADTKDEITGGYYKVD